MIQRFGDFEALSFAAAELFNQRARFSIEKNGKFTVALSGGKTPKRAYQLLKERPFLELVPWEHIHIFWGDERCVPPTDPMSNEWMIRQALLDDIPIPPSQIHPINCWKSPHTAALAYEDLLHKHFQAKPAQFDLIFLGLGENGHTASLFPYTNVLHNTTQWVADVYLPDKSLYRVTLTAGLINKAAMVVFLVSGTNKARILREVLEGKHDPDRFPAQLIKPENGDLLWLVDKEASVFLSKEV